MVRIPEFQIFFAFLFRFPQKKKIAVSTFQRFKKTLLLPLTPHPFQWLQTGVVNFRHDDITSWPTLLAFNSVFCVRERLVLGIVSPWFATPPPPIHTPHSQLPTLHSPLSILHSPHSPHSPHIPHFPLYTLQSTISNLYSTISNLHSCTKKGRYVVSVLEPLPASSSKPNGLFKGHNNPEKETNVLSYLVHAVIIKYFVLLVFCTNFKCTLCKILHLWHCLGKVAELGAEKHFIVVFTNKRSQAKVSTVYLSYG